MFEPAKTRPLLSVVIPTKDRYSTLLPTIRALLEHIRDRRLQLVVQDNSSDNGLILSYLQDYPDARISYRHYAQAISIVENTERALNSALGEYITFIGDDDLVSPLIMGVVEQLLSAGVEVATYPPAYYWWTSVTFSKPSQFHQPGAFWYPHRKAEALVKHTDPRAEVERVLASGAVSLFALPKLYHGVVHRSVLDRVRQAAGRVICGASPDMALAISLGLTARTHVIVDCPLTIYGASRNSGGGFTAANRHFGKLEEQKHLPRETIDGWSPKLPRVWSEHTIYPQTAREVLAAFGLPDTINYTSFYASMLVNEPHLRSLTWPLVVEHLRQSPASLPPGLGSLVRKGLGRTLRYLRARMAVAPYMLTYCPGPADCMNQLQRLTCPQLGLSPQNEPAIEHQH